jgi:hypothetical protein
MTLKVAAKGLKIGIVRPNGEFNLLHTLRFRIVDFRGKSMYSSDRYPGWRTRGEWIEDTRATVNIVHEVVRSEMVQK